MTFRWLKRYMPRSLYARGALILLVPVLTIQLVVSVVFIQRHFEGVTEQMSRNVILELGYLLDLAAAAPDAAAARARVGFAAEALALDIDLPADIGDPQDERLFYDLSGRVVTSELRAALPVAAVDLSDIRRVAITLATPHGPMEVSFRRSRVSASNPHQLLVLMVVVSLLMTLVAYAFLRNQLRPIARLAAAAEAFGKGRILPYRPGGATEVRSAGSAFLDMRNRIERQTQQRTLMLSGVSHDLRTPLTRMKLELSMLEDGPESEALRQDVNDMEKMLDTFLDFARLEALDDAVETDPLALARELVEKSRRAGQPVELGTAEGDGTAMLRPLAIERALDNLVTNAVRHGTRARVSCTLSGRAVRFSVEDDGSGIPAEARDEAMKPFQRLDAARNQNRGGGVGLGLAIAADIARQHGGALRLGESEMGGLRADLVLAR
ncbi:ATP-binding protein [Tranquillimonas alkanivorans]|uniref:histidine kinase n=1 Tax=Tranquillimonas alkanivorans TaxID=441119 RepID=A0A1I5NGM2_9RHOB|nr:ATP-binding protein [Tranquillimonas alkanivorans]SFP20840.1 two-component system, OmpR family, osmolarity sensor histidine kinase EnvZ [Tranquillimonas alkanivorans]